MIKAILACDESWGIGKDNDLPWPKNSEDLKWFKQTTSNKTVVMGSATWDSLPVKPLPNRENIIMRSRIHTEPEEYLRNLAKLRGEIWIIGGARLINNLLPIIDEFHLSRISGKYDCDTFLPSGRILSTYQLHEVSSGKGLNIERWKRI